MSLIKRDDFFPNLPSFFNDFFNRDWMDWSNQNSSLTNTTLPSVNIRESEAAFDVELAAPGMVKEDFKIELNHNVLTISSEKKNEKETKEEGKYTRREFSYQSFSRSFTLPNVADSENIVAKYEKGILTIHIPKREEAKTNPIRVIEIK